MIRVDNGGDQVDLEHGMRTVQILSSVSLTLKRTNKNVA